MAHSVKRPRVARDGSVGKKVGGKEVGSGARRRPVERDFRLRQASTRQAAAAKDAEGGMIKHGAKSMAHGAEDG